MLRISLVSSSGKFIFVGSNGEFEFGSIVFFYLEYKE